MERNLLILGLIIIFNFTSFATQKDSALEELGISIPSENKIYSKNSKTEIGFNLSTIEKEIRQVNKMYGKQCAPEELAFAEAYIETYKGIEYKNKRIKVSKIDKLIFLEKAQVYISRAKEKLYSDVDQDGKPCYKEIAEGSDPLYPDNVSNPKNTNNKTSDNIKTNNKLNNNKASNIAKKLSKTVNKEKNQFKPLKIHARVHFEFDKATIKREYLPYLNVIIRHLKQNPKLLVKIIGYTDNIGSKSYNDKLAMKRAKAVKNYLIKHGISAKRIEILGKGKADYLFDNKTKINRFTNRRADFFIMEPVNKKGA